MSEISTGFTNHKVHKVTISKGTYLEGDGNFWVICIFVVDIGECPPSNKGVGCEHGIRGRTYSISAIFVKRKRPSVDSTGWWW